MKLFQYLICSVFWYFSETFPLLGEDGSGVNGSVLDPCLEKSIMELRALVTWLCDNDYEEEQSSDIDYWVAVCNCIMTNSLPCPHCSVTAGSVSGEIEDDNHFKFANHQLDGASSTSSPIKTTYKKQFTTTKAQHTWSQNHTNGDNLHNRAQLPLPVKQFGDYTHSNNFIRFG